jgi:MYXO-CTERM domain-containing protein
MDPDSDVPETGKDGVDSAEHQRAHAEGFGFATEADADSFTIDTQYYLCTELDLAEADPHFGSTGVGGVGAQHGATGKGSGIGTAKNLRTPDGGLTWLVDLITLPAMNPQGPQTAAPVFNCSGSGGSSGTGGAPGTGGMASTGGAPGTGGTKAVTGGSTGAGGTMASGGSPSTGGERNPAAGGTPSTGGLVGNGGIGGVPANTGGTTASSVSTTSATGGSNTVAGGGNGVGGSLQASGGASALADNASTSSNSADNANSCSCSVPGHDTRRSLFALALAGAALTLRARRRR